MDKIEVLKQLKQGVRRFRSEVYPARAALFRQAAGEPQRPHTLFITCADSRIDPLAITSSRIGELFVTRNIGNMVPSHRERMASVGAVIEYAVKGLGVRHAVVCGHSDCGAMKALLHPGAAAEMPAVGGWLVNAQPAKAAAERLQIQGEGTNRDLSKILAEQNVLLQLSHLKTHPSVAAAIDSGRLTVSGWVYDIGSGEIRIAEDGQHTFTSV